MMTASPLTLELQAKQRDDVLDILRGLTMFIVVLAHAMQHSLLPGEESILWMRFIRPFQMPILFLISGWAMAFSFPPKSHAVFIRKKSERLLLPYLVWMLIFYMICITDGSNVFTFNNLWREVIGSDFWFLRALFFNYLVIWIGVLVLEKWRIQSKWGPVITVVLGLVAVLLIRKIDAFRPTANGWFYQWFLTGYLAHVFSDHYRDRVRAFMNRYKVRIGLICGVLLITMACLVYLWDISQNLVAYVTIPCICFVVIGFSRILPPFISKLLSHWGAISLGIYAIHWCLFAKSASWFAKVVPNCPYVIRVLALTAVWMLGCEILIRIFKKTKVTRYFLLGER